MKIGFLVLCCLIASIHSEYVLVDQTFQGNDFKDPNGWVIQGNARADLFNTCNGVRIFGGDRVMGTKAVALKNVQLPPHHSLKLKLQFWKIDSWDNEIAYIWVDDALIWQRTFDYNHGQQMCGRTQGWLWDVVNVEVELKHTGASAVVVITSNLDEPADNESWGIRDFQLFVDKCPDGCSACQKDDKPEQCNIWESAVSFWSGLNAKDLSDAEGWNVVGAKGDTTNCGGVQLLGGFDKFGAKAAINKQIKLPPHYKLKIKTLFAKIDSWDNEIGYLKLDGTTVWQKAFQYNQGYWVSICGQPNDWRELFNRIEVDADHTADAVNVEFTSNLDEPPNNESWGVRDFYVFVAKCADKCSKCKGPKPADCTCNIHINKECANDWALQNGVCAPLSNFVLLDQAFQEQKFTETNGWTLKGNKAGKLLSECGDKSLLGGFGVLGGSGQAEKTFQIPSHKRLRLVCQIYKIDSWDNEWMFIKVDGVDVYKQQWNLQTGGGSFCGQGVWNDAIFDVDEIFNHQGEKATILFTSSLDEDPENGIIFNYQESWGMRQFKLFYEPKEQCAIFYSECDYKGASFEFCSKSPNFPKDNVPPVIRSIKVPPQGKVTLYESVDYNGKKVVFTKDQPCINEWEFSFLQSAHVEAPEWLEVPSMGQIE